MSTSFGDDHQHKQSAVNGASLDGHIAMDHRYNESPQLRLNHQIPQQVSVPHKPLISPLMQW